MLLKSIAGDEGAGTTELFAPRHPLRPLRTPRSSRSVTEATRSLLASWSTSSISAATGTTELFETSPDISPVPLMSLDFPTAVLDLLFFSAPAKIALR